MSNEELKPTYRLLNDGEVIEKTDEFYRAGTGNWIGCFGVPGGLEGTVCRSHYAPVRRLLGSPLNVGESGQEVVAWINEDQTAFIFHRNTLKDPEYYRGKYPIALTYAHPQEVVVSPLQWREIQGGHYAFTSWEAYSITVTEDAWPFVVRPYPTGGQSNYRTLEDAKAAAEKDHFDKVSNCLAKPQEVVALPLDVRGILNELEIHKKFPEVTAFPIEKAQRLGDWLRVHPQEVTPEVQEALDYEESVRITKKQADDKLEIYGSAAYSIDITKLLKAFTTVANAYRGLAVEAGKKAT